MRSRSRRRWRNHIESTRALDGTQEDSFGDYQARWTYHPDNGMNLTVWTGDSSHPLS